jgi:thiol-disulfide isomerase/thioredoxin
VRTLKKFARTAAALFSATLLQATALNAPAPKFVLKDTNQKPHALAEYKGNIVFVNFWASWCAPCRQELPELNRLAAEYRGQNVKVLAINIDEHRPAAKTLLSKLRLSAPAFSVLWDPQSKVVSAYKIDAMPSSFILDGTGIVRFAHAGFHPKDPASWREEINKLLR